MQENDKQRKKGLQSVFPVLYCSHAKEQYKENKGGLESMRNWAALVRKHTTPQPTAFTRQRQNPYNFNNLHRGRGWFLGVLENPVESRRPRSRRGGHSLGYHNSHKPPLVTPRHIYVILRQSCMDHKQH